MMKRIGPYILLLALVFAITAGARAQFRDDFDGKLQSGWRWLDPKGDCVQSLNERPGFLRITVSGYHDLWPANRDYHAPRLLREADGDFIIETRIAGPGRWWGGLLVWKDYKNFVRFERGVRFKNSLYLASNNNGQFVDVAWDYVEGDPMWLRLERRGARFEASYSLDGREWLSLQRLLIDMPKNLPNVEEDTFSAIAEKDFVFRPTVSWAEMTASGPFLVGLDALSTPIGAAHKVRQTVTDFDYFELRKP